MNKVESVIDLVSNKLKNSCNEVRIEIRKTGDSLTNELNTFREDMHRGFDSLNKNFDSIDNHLDTIAEHSDTIIKNVVFQIFGIFFIVAFALFWIFILKIYL